VYRDSDFDALSRLECFDVVLDNLTDTNVFLRRKTILKQSGTYIATISTDICSTIINDTGYNFAGHYFLQNCPEHQDMLANLLLEGKIKCPITDIVDFNIEGARTIMDKIATGKSTGVHILRVSSIAFFVLFHFKICRTISIEAMQIIRNYVVEVKKDQSCLFCCYIKCDEYSEEYEEWVLIELWNNERAMRSFQVSPPFFYLKSISMDKNWFNLLRISRDCADVLLYSLQSPITGVANDFFYVAVVVKVFIRCEDNFVIMLKAHNAKNRSSPGCILYTFTKVLSDNADDIVEYVIYYIHTSMETFDESDELVELLKSCKDFYKVCNVTALIRSARRQTFQRLALATGPYFVADIVHDTMRFTVPEGQSIIQIISSSRNPWDMMVRVFLNGPNDAILNIFHFQRL